MPGPGKRAGRPMTKRPVIAIDGPAGAGKSTIARLVAENLDLVYIDTGAMYRALTLKALEEGRDCLDASAMEDLASRTVIEFLPGKEGTPFVMMDGRDVSREIRGPDVNRWVSQVAVHRAVRLKMVSLQREMALRGGVVLDGRDIGTYVAPGADVKFFLTADLKERARRRCRELQEKGFSVSEEDVLEEVARRDRIDSERTLAPLRQASDAILVDTTGMGIQEVLEVVLCRIREEFARAV